MPMLSLHATLHDDRPPVRLAAILEICTAARRELPPGTTYAATTHALVDAVRAKFAQLTDDDAIYLIRMVR
jgi:hypothetical protein